jgi:hypothetical protein
LSKVSRNNTLNLRSCNFGNQRPNRYAENDATSPRRRQNLADRVQQFVQILKIEHFHVTLLVADECRLVLKRRAAADGRGMRLISSCLYCWPLDFLGLVVLLLALAEGALEIKKVRANLAGWNLASLIERLALQGGLALGAAGPHLGVVESHLPQFPEAQTRSNRRRRYQPSNALGDRSS